MRNPKWHRKELILALDLYFKLEPGQISSLNPEIIALHF
jgi:5-methylcytosine-specific restriction enzyme A